MALRQYHRANSLSSLALRAAIESLGTSLITVLVGMVTPFSQLLNDPGYLLGTMSVAAKCVAYLVCGLPQRYQLIEKLR